MLLTVDLGNTCVKFGLFHENKQLAFDMIKTQSSDYKSFILQFIYKAGVRENMVENIIMSSVVPSVKDKLVNVIINIFNKEPIQIDNRNNYGVVIDTDDPSEVGNDILVMISYGYYLYKQDLILCSLGTCSVICYVNKEGIFSSCIIAPGFKKMAEVLYTSSEQLPEFKMEKRNSFIARNTIDAMNVGFFNGYIGMIEYLIICLKRELNKNCLVLGCGGGSKDIAPHTKIFNYIEPDFVTKGLNYIYNRYYV